MTNEPSYSFQKRTKKYNNFLYIIFIIIISLILISTYIDLKSKKDNMDKYLQAMKSNIIFEYKQKLKESIHTTMFFIDNLYSFYLNKEKNKTKSNTLSKLNYTQFENAVRFYLYNTIFDEQRYTWVNEIKNKKGGKDYAIRLIHPNLKDSEGIFLSTEFKDIKGNSPYLEELKGVLKNNEIFYSYFFKEYKSNKTTQKLSYARYYKKLNWIIATGIPLNILEDKIDSLRKELVKDYDRYLILTVFIKVLLLIIVIFIFYFLKNNTKRYLSDSLLKSYNKLKETSTKLTEATKLANIGVWKWDLKTNIYDWNDEMYKIYEINTKNKSSNFKVWEKTLHKDDIEKVKDKLNHCIAFGNKFQSTFRIRTKKGLKYIKASGMTVYNKYNEPLYMIGVNYDITNIKEYELQQVKLLEQSKMASLGEMIGNIAHQWRQPLSVISTASTGLKLQKQMNILTDKLLYEELESINKSVKYLNDTIEIFRNFIKEEKEYKKVIIQDKINETFELSKATLLNNHIKLISNINDIEDIEIKMVSGELSQVLINIINNAKDVFKERKIKEPVIEILLKKIKNDKILITIQDNAGGISDDIIEHIFEPYYTTKHQSQGTGLGLYMSYKIITESLKGKLYVENSKEGARFCIELPLLI
ncbi:ATP-binding protein [Arcobacter sp. YIC-310]|uniref:ATP-binding protein n=1 Tax=Arcobacter sp. YIC-310 TaxID=3376632 RepID=UPI003C1467AF